MRVLVVGAGGFIGSAVVAALSAAGLQTRCVVRTPESFLRRFPDVNDVHGLDLTSEGAGESHYWDEMLDGVDAAVYVAGVLQPDVEAHAWAVHHQVPEVLFQACEKHKVRRVIYISAVGVEETETVYARSKRAGEAALLSRDDLNGVVLRPPIVVGEGSFGGTSLLRALAVFPAVTPVIGDGSTPVDLIHRQDLAAGIVALLAPENTFCGVLEPAGSERCTLLKVIQRYRAWFGLTPRPVLRIPFRLAMGFAYLGDLFRFHPLTSTALRQFQGRLIAADPVAFTVAAKVRPAGFRQILSARLCDSQDLWHARLFLLRPLVRLSLVALWLVSGLSGLFWYSQGVHPFGEFSFFHDWGGGVLILFSVVDILVGLALLFGRWLRFLFLVQFGLLGLYTLIFGVFFFPLWVEPLGGLLKNLPLLVLLLVHRTLEEER